MTVVGSRQPPAGLFSVSGRLDRESAEGYWREEPGHSSRFSLVRAFAIKPLGFKLVSAPNLRSVEVT